MKRTWLMRLTPEQFTKLHKGLHGRFRFYLNLAFESVTYDPKTAIITVHVLQGEHDLAERISTYINGYACAIYP